VLVLGTFFLGLLCKESTGMLPFVIMSFLATDRASPWLQKLKYLWPFLIGIIAYLSLRQYFGITNVHQTGQAQVLVLGFVTFLRSVITDLRLFIFPVDLHYDRCLPLLFSFKQPMAWGTCLIWGGALGIFVFYYRKFTPFVLFLMAWFCIELFPVSQLIASIGVGVGRISTADHFLYLACIPVFIGLVMAFQRVYAINTSKTWVAPSLLKFMAGGFLLFLLLTAVEQSIYASNEFNMVKRSLAFEPDNPRIQGSMAILSVFRNDIPDAEKHFRAAIKAEPFNPTYHIGLGTALCQQGKWIEGMEQFVAFEPSDENKALVERQEKMTMGHLRQQLDHGKSFDARGWLAIGIYYAKIGEQAKAIDSFHRTIDLNPGQTDAWFNLGSLYEAGQNWPEARMAYMHLLSLKDISGFQRDFAQQHLAAIGKR